MTNEYELFDGQTVVRNATAGASDVVTTLAPWRGDAFLCATSSGKIRAMEPSGTIRQCVYCC